MQVCAVTCSPHKHPVFYRDGEAQAFVVRSGNSTVTLKQQEAYEYISDQWSSHDPGSTSRELAELLEQYGVN